MRGLGLAAAILSASPAIAEPLHLLCAGGGAANRVHQTTGSAWSNNGDYASGTAYSQSSVGFDDQVDIELGDNGASRIRMPRAMLPPIRGGAGGWFEVSKVERTQDEIKGVIQVNFINSPKLRIDRRTGQININGKAGDFSGTCRKYDPAAAAQQF